jgi:hypothetical protein
MRKTSLLILHGVYISDDRFKYVMFHDVIESGRKSEIENLSNNVWSVTGKLTRKQCV